MASERRVKYEAELNSLKPRVSSCPKCKGLGVTKAILITDRKLTAGRLKNSDRYEQSHMKAQDILRKRHIRLRGENPRNSSFGLCKCKIAMEALQELIMGQVPTSFYTVKSEEIVPREVSIIGFKKVDLQKAVGWYIKGLAEAKQNAMGINLFGRYSRGKTWTIQYIAAQVVKKRYSVQYIPMFLLLDLIRQSETPLLREMLDVDFLIIDEIGNEHPNRKQYSGELSYFLRKRINWKKPTCFVFETVAKPEEIITQYGPAFSSTCLERNINIHMQDKVVSEQQTKRFIRRFFTGI